MEESVIHINIADQTLRLVTGGRTVCTYLVSTAKNGPGERMGSECTPRGRHVVRAKIGAGCGHGTIFKRRRPTGEIYNEKDPALAQRTDIILCRILWLCGREPGKNRFGNVDTMRRYVYIHGCPDSAPMGIPLSHGCIRMRNVDIAELFDLVQPGTQVIIEEHAVSTSRA